MEQFQNFKHHKQSSKGFTIIPNTIFHNYKLSAKAKGLLVTLLSLPPDWNFSEKGLKKLFPDGLASIKTGLRELEEAGHIARERVRNEKGQLKGTVWHIYEEPYFPEKQGDTPVYEPPIPESYYYDWMNE